MGLHITGTALETDCIKIVANTATTRCGLGPTLYAYGIQTFGYLYASIYGMGYHGNSNDSPAGSSIMRCMTPPCLMDRTEFPVRQPLPEEKPMGVLDM